MKLRDLRPRAAAFCCDCGERITAEIRPRFGGPRCAGCRAVARTRPGAVTALGIAAAACAAFWLGRVGAPAPRRPPTLAPPVVPITAAPPGAAPTPPAEPLHPCGARTRRGTPCKRLVRGPGRCYQHGGPPP